MDLIKTQTVHRLDNTPSDVYHCQPHTPDVYPQHPTEQYISQTSVCTCPYKFTTIGREEYVRFYSNV